MRMNTKQVMLSILQKPKTKILSKKLPKHLRRYPNMKFGKRDIIDIEYKVKDKIILPENDTPIKLKLKGYRKDLNLKEERPQRHDYINFKNMSGNEILVNMMNVKYFRMSELVSAFYEFSKRLNLAENKEAKETVRWTHHPYFESAFRRVLLKMPQLSLNHLIVSSIALDSFNFGKQTGIWKVVENNVDRLMHKLKPSNIILFLDLLNRQPNRTSKDFLNKLLTIIPIHVENLKDSELIKLITVCINQDLVNERLFLYFIYPRIEARASKLSFSHYIKIIKLLADLHYQEDLEYWNNGILPCIFNFEYSQEDANKLWTALLKVKVDCPNVDISKHMILIENILKQFENLKSSGADITDILLKLEKDFSLIPSKKETLTLKQVKEAEKRLKDQATMKSFMDKINQQDLTIDKSKEAESSINKLLEIKDWKKARYELNLAETEKLKETKMKLKEEKAKNNLEKKKIQLEKIKTEKSADTEKDKDKEIKEDSSIDVDVDVDNDNENKI